VDSETKKSQSQEVCKVSDNRKRSGNNSNQSKPEKSNQSGSKIKVCVPEHQHKKEICPALKKKCNSCGMMNHFSSCCKSSKTSNSVDVATIFSIAPSASITKKTKTVAVIRTGEELNFHIDTGASCNVILKMK